MADSPVNLNFEERYKLNNFMREMTSVVSFQRPPSEDHLWAFWCEQTLSSSSSGDSVTHASNTDQGIITEKIKFALLHFNNIFQQGDVLIQFWAPMTTETGCLELVTADQPFALTKHLDERLLKYRKHCLEYKFNVNGSQHLGIPGRVFRQKWHECISDVRDYNSKEYPQRNFALSCDISASFAFPVFQTSFQDCVGVIEFVTNTDSTSLDMMCYSFLQDALQTAGLKSSLYYLLISRIHEEHLNEICEGVKVVCTTHRLPLAHTSVPYKHFYEDSMENSSDTFDVNSILRLQWPKSYVGNQKLKKDSAKPPEPPKDYIHIRARRVQATDSHSPAERVRRYKINERMKLLQNLVPGCNKVTRKTVILDEIVYYVLSLQRQVEFFSMKLATVNPRMDINIEAILSKDICQSHGAMPHNISPSDTSATAFPCGYQSQQGPQLHSGIYNGTETPFSMNPSMQRPPIDGFGDIASQSTCTETYDYILESFPNPENKYGEDPSTLWCSLYNGQEMMQPHSLNQQLIVGVDDINDGRNVVNAGQNSILVSCSDESFMNQEFASFQYQYQRTRSPSGLAVLHNGPEMMQPHSSNQQLIVGGRNVASSSTILVEMADPPINLNFDERYKLNNFMREMTSVVSFQRPPSEDHLWAFWCEPTLSSPSSGDSVTHTSTTNQGIITEKIKCALLHFNNIFQQGAVLIQFWAPMTTETGCLELVTSDQPFALTKHLDERLLKYRKHCLEYKFNVDGSQQHLGIPGRVFRQKWHECISDVRDYTSKEYPQRNFALSCDISASFAFPVFQTSFQDCVGVIEFVTNTDSTTLDIMCYSFLHDALKTAGLKSSLCYLLISRIHEEHLNEICEGVKVVCTTHRLPYAHTSVPYKHFYEGSDMFEVDSILRLQLPKSYAGNQKQNRDSAKPPEAPKDYIHVRARRVQATDSHSLAERVRREKISERMKFLQYLVPGSNKVTGKVNMLDEFIKYVQSLQCQVEFFSMKLATINTGIDFNMKGLLSNDICQSRGAMPHNIYPLDISATAFPCGYQSQQGPQLHSGISNGTETPFSMNPWNAPLHRNPSMQLPPTDGFSDIASQDLASLQCQSTRSPYGLAVLHNGQEMMFPHSSNQQLIVGVDDINNGRNAVNAEQNSILVSCSDETCMNQEFASFQCQSTRSPSGFAVSQNEKEMMQPHSSNQQLIVRVNDINNGRSVVNAEQNSILVSCSDETCMNVPASFQCQSIISPPGPGVLDNGQEAMQPHSSNHQLIVEVDDINNGKMEQNNTPVSSLDEPNSITCVELKKHFGKKLEDVAKIFGVSRSTIKRKCRENGISRWPQGKRNKINDSPSRRDPPCSDLLAKKFVATVPHKTPLVAPPPAAAQVARTITIKATCGDDVLKFQLPCSSTMVELEEEVSKRLKYVETYKVKYTDNDGDQVLIACDKDLENCISASNSLGINRIEMFIVPITKISPST